MRESDENFVQSAEKEEEKTVFCSIAYSSSFMPKKRESILYYAYTKIVGLYQTPEILNLIFHIFFSSLVFIVITVAFTIQFFFSSENCVCCASELKQKNSAKTQSQR